MIRDERRDYLARDGERLTRGCSGGLAARREKAAPAPGSCSVTAEVVAACRVGAGEPHLVSGAVFWVAVRPSEGGRHVLVPAGDDGRVEDVTAPGTNVRTRVHEYGGGAFLVAGETVFF